MKKFFNNIWFVSGLSLMAIGYFLFSIIIPLSERFSNEDNGGEFNISIGEIEDDITEQNLANSSIGKTVERQHIAWISELDRDPFAQTASSRLPDLGAAKRDLVLIQQNSTVAKSNTFQTPILTGLFHKANNSTAVIDGELLHEGDIISGFEVRSINKSSVVVARNGRDYALTIKSNR